MLIHLIWFCVYLFFYIWVRSRNCGCLVTWFCYQFLLLLISMLWHRQVIFESKGDKLSSSAESRIRTHQGLRHQIASRLNARWQTDWAMEDKKKFNSTARPYDQPAFSPLDPTAVWHSHLALAIYMFVVVNFDALAQASDIQMERRQVVFLCWEQNSNPSGSQTPNRQQTECPLTNRLSYRGSKKLELDSPSLWSASIQPTWSHSCLAFAPGSGDIWFCVYLFFYIWVRSWNCSCLVTWFCYQLIAKPGNKTATVSWPDPYILMSIIFACLTFIFKRAFYFAKYPSTLFFDRHSLDSFYCILRTFPRIYFNTSFG